MSVAIDKSSGGNISGLDFDPDALRAKYRQERDRRLRPDANAQYVETSGDFKHYVDDPYVEPGFTRAPLNDEVDALIPAVDRALAWITDYGDKDGDGYVEYERTSDRGLLNQGWKDSWDSMRFMDGSLATPPIVSVESARASARSTHRR